MSPPAPQIALDKGDFASAVDFAERAVGNTPSDAGFRALLGNAYFGAGRFASAESAYRDSLTLNGSQPQVVLKLALVTIAQGKRDAAMAVLDGARNLLDPADYGLALALAGQPQEAVTVLDNAARAGRRRCAGPPESGAGPCARRRLERPARSRRRTSPPTSSTRGSSSG